MLSNLVALSLYFGLFVSATLLREASLDSETVEDIINIMRLSIIYLLGLQNVWHNMVVPKCATMGVTISSQEVISKNVLKSMTYVFLDF